MISSQSHGSVYDRVIGKGIRHDHMHQRIMCTSAPGFETENKKSSYSPRDIAEMLQISENLVYEKGRCGIYLSGLLEEISEKSI